MQARISFSRFRNLRLLGQAPSLLFVDKGAFTLGKRTERVSCWNGGYDLHEIPRAIGLGWLLCLKEIHISHHAAVFSNCAVLRHEIVDRNLFIAATTAVASSVPAAFTAFK